MGPNKIIGIEKEDFTSINKEAVIVVVFSNGEKQRITEKALALLVTDNPIDYTALFEKREKIMSDKLLAEIMDYGFTFSEITKLLENVSARVTDIFDKASHVYWTGGIKGWVHGSNQVLFRSLLDAEKALNSIAKEDVGGK